MTIDIPEKFENLKLMFTGNSNIIKLPDPGMSRHFSQFPFIGLYGICPDGEKPEKATETENFNIEIETEISGNSISSSCKNGTIRRSGDNSAQLPDINDFVLYSFSDYHYPEGTKDPVLFSENLKSFFIRNSRDNKPAGKDIPAREKALNELNKKKQLLELKKMKKDKLKKEIHSSEKELSRLMRKKESIESYKKSLNDVFKITQDVVKLSSKINNMKKDIIDLRDMQDKGKKLEKELAARFPQFSIEMIEKIPDLDILQNQFNTIRDVNEQIDKFNTGKKRKESLTVKSVSGLLLFSFISLVFLFFKSIQLSAGASLLLKTLSVFSLVISAAAVYYIFFVLRKKQPEELRNRKEATEKSLLEVFKSVNFPLKDFATGELYEYLFQYFEDFISFRELQSELTSIKKKFSSTSVLEEKEDKLESLISQKEDMDKDIKHRLKQLDSNIHPAPEVHDIAAVIPEIDEMISDVKKEISHKKSITDKIEKEAKQYESGDLQHSAIDDIISGIDTEIIQMQNDIKNLRAGEENPDEETESAFEEKLKALAVKSAEIYQRITGNTGEKKEIASSIRKLIKTGDHGSFNSDSIKIIALSTRVVLPEIMDLPLNPPLILNEPFDIDENEIVENIKKILLELSEKRQVLIITSADVKDLTGNLINI